MNNVKEIHIKNRMYYFLDNMINKKSIDSNKIMIDQKSWKIVLTHYAGYMTTNSVKPLYLIVNKIKEYTKKVMKITFFDPSSC